MSGALPRMKKSENIFFGCVIIEKYIKNGFTNPHKKSARIPKRFFPFYCATRGGLPIISRKALRDGSAVPVKENHA